MKQITKLWTQLTDNLVDLNDDDSFNEEIYSKFDEIFDLKDVEEYKGAVYTDTQSPSQFRHTSMAMRKALVEGYLLAQMEQKKNNVKLLYKCYNKNMPEKKEVKDEHN